MNSLVILLLLSILYNACSHLTVSQQKSIRIILANPNTPMMIRIKTRNILYEHYHDWARSICKTYLKKRWNGSILPELDQCISMGLLRAIDRYNWSKTTSFPNYAKKYVLGSLIRGMDKWLGLRKCISFVSPEDSWMFDKYRSKKKEEDFLLDKPALLSLLDPEEKRLFQYVYGHLFDDSPKKSVSEICELMMYGNRETFRIRRSRMHERLVQYRDL